MALLLVLAAMLGVMKGAVHIPLSELLLESNRAIFIMRVVRVCAAILTGIGLATAGIALQAILRNPLAEPYLLGTSSGAGLAAVIGLILGMSRLFLPLAAFSGAVVSVIIVYGLGSKGGRTSDMQLILSGVIVSVAFSAVIVFLVSVFGNEALHEMHWWLWGSLQVTDIRLLLIVSCAVLSGTGLIFLFAQDLNAMSLGEEESTHLGIDTQEVRKIIIALASFVTASLICLCGIIGFVGLIVPHIMRMAVGPNHKRLIPAAWLGASSFMVLCDLLSRTIVPPLEIPIGVITAVIGAPVFIILIKRGKRS